MPMAIVVVISMLFGLHSIPLILMTWGCKVLMVLANTINSWPGTYVPVGVRSEWFMILILAGSFWWLNWTHRWRWFGSPLVVMAFFLPKKDVFFMVSHDRARIGIMAGETVLLTQSGRPNFVSQDWKGIGALYDLEKLSKSSSQWVRPYEWGWMIQPFVRDETLVVAVVKDPSDLVSHSAPVKVLGFPKISQILLQNGQELQGGLALWRDTHGEIHVIQDEASEQRFPWR
jgi:hypothetical protein